MHILLFNDTRIPARTYGGTERVIVWLGKALTQLGHRVSYLVGAGSTSANGQVIAYDPSRPLHLQVPESVDVVHLHHWPAGLPINVAPTTKPWLRTVHGNGQPGERYPVNSVFLSHNHAERHHATAWVHNGLDPDDYGPVDWTMPRTHALFLGKARWKVKNLAGAKSIARAADLKLAVLGGDGWDLTGRTRYLGMVGGAEKNEWLNQGQVLLFPVVWDEPFGLAVIEAMYFGCPVVATPFGSLPELVPPEVGVVSDSLAALSAAAKDHARFDRMRVQAWVMERFTAERMAQNYIAVYERVLNGEGLNAKQPHASNRDTGLFQLGD